MKGSKAGFTVKLWIS